MHLLVLPVVEERVPLVDDHPIRPGEVREDVRDPPRRELCAGVVVGRDPGALGDHRDRLVEHGVVRRPGVVGAAVGRSRQREGERPQHEVARQGAQKDEEGERGALDALAPHLLLALAEATAQPAPQPRDAEHGGGEQEGDLERRVVELDAALEHRGRERVQRVLGQGDERRQRAEQRGEPERPQQRQQVAQVGLREQVLGGLPGVQQRVLGHLSGAAAVVPVAGDEGALVAVVVRDDDPDGDGEPRHADEA